MENMIKNRLYYAFCQFHHQKGNKHAMLNKSDHGELITTVYSVLRGPLTS